MPEEYDIPQQHARRAFEALAMKEDAAIDLAQAALIIASEEYPHLNITHYLDQLDTLAHKVRAKLGLPSPDAPPQPSKGPESFDVLLVMNQVLFDEERFHGNQEDYYDPRNSFFNDVLERHQGIPITLSLLYIEVGRRLGLQIDGIGLPFHFVVGCRLPHGTIYIDPFDHGRLLSEQECRELVLNMLKGRVTFNPRWLEPVNHKKFLVRMLNNLKHIYIHAEDYERALSMCERILLLTPNAPLERRDRGLVHLHLKHYARALRDFSAYLELAPQAEDSKEIRQQIKTLRQLIAMMN